MNNVYLSLFMVFVILVGGYSNNVGSTQRSPVDRQSAGGERRRPQCPDDGR